MIGLASDRLSSKGYERPDYRMREARLVETLESLGCRAYIIREIDSAFPPGLVGQAYDELASQVTVIVASQETAPNAGMLNEERAKNGLAPLKIVEVPLLLAADSRPIAARRIAAGEIDGNGRRTS